MDYTDSGAVADTLREEADDDCTEAGYNGYCEDYPCCGHTALDPCARQPYDEPGYYDTSRPGNEHALCNHEENECEVDYDDYYNEDEE